MAVAFDAKMTGGNGAGGAYQRAGVAASVTSNTGMTIGGSGTLIVAVLFVQAGSGSTTNHAATWNSVSMTRSVTITNGACSAVIFTLASPATGQKVLATSWTTNGDAYLSCASFTGTDTTKLINTADSVSGNSGTTVTVTSDATGATLALWGTNGGDPTVGGTGAVEIFSDAPDNPGAGASYTIGNSSNSHTFTGAGGTTPAYAGVHIIVPASSFLPQKPSVTSQAVKRAAFFRAWPSEWARKASDREVMPCTTSDLAMFSKSMPKPQSQRHMPHSIDRSSL